ncbi:unnamed protein product, partial [Scytosiphon promiscuus]
PPQEDLITFPRFKPHALTRPTLFSTDNPAGGGPDGVKLLNASEKIKELEELVESSRSHNERLLEDLEEVQTDKVSMEYLLREKLERLVQSEIEARVARMHQV